MNEDRFWEIMNLLNWKKAGNDELVVRPVVTALSKLSDEDIFEFDEIMSKLLYDIDGQQWDAENEELSGDSFLYYRCVAVVNGRDYYYAVKELKTKLDPDLEFESALYIPAEAWAKKNKKDSGDYPHITKYSFESFSNIKNWPHLNNK